MSEKISLVIVQQRIYIAKQAVVDLLDKYHYDEITGEDVEIILSSIRNQLNSVLNDLGKCSS